MLQMLGERMLCIGLPPTQSPSRADANHNWLHKICNKIPFSSLSKNTLVSVLSGVFWGGALPQSSLLSFMPHPQPSQSLFHVASGCLRNLLPIPPPPQMTLLLIPVKEGMVSTSPPVLINLYDAMYYVLLPSGSSFLIPN